MRPIVPVVALLAALALGGEARASEPADGAKPTKAKKKSSKKQKAEEAARAEAEAAAAAQAEEAATINGLTELRANPEIAGVLAELDDATVAKLEALSPDAVAVLLEKMGAEEPLTDEETAIAQAFAEAFIRSQDKAFSYQHGDVTIEGGMATLHLGDEHRYLGPADAQRVLTEGWGNPPDSTVLGMIVPKDVSPLHPELGWGVVVTFSEDGYVEDDDAEDIDYDELLADMQAGTNEANPERVRQGYPALELVGWAEAPHYDGETHRLYWAKELATVGAPEHSLNYSIRVLGRKGVLELNAVAAMEMLPQIKPAMEQVMTQVEFEVGHRYEDFDPDIDKVAAYGIGGLIAGKVLLKTGIFAGLLKLLLVGKKFLIVGALAIGAGLKAWFSRKKAE